MEWISNLKVGDPVHQIEVGSDGNIYKWKGKVFAIESNYIEVEYNRDFNNEDYLNLIQKLLKDGKLSVIHRTFERTWIKNYFSPDGTINIEEIGTD